MKLLLCGDSTMLGSTGTAATGYTQSPNNVPAVVANLMAGRVTVQNCALGGSTTGQWLFGQSPVPMSWDTRMATTDAQWVGINTGINDSFLPGFGYADYRWAYAELARIAVVHGKGIVFITPTPINDPHNAALWAFQNGIKSDLAPSIGAPVINVWDAVVAACPSWPAMLPDGIHPNDDLYRLMGAVVYSALLPIMGVPPLVYS